MEHNAFLEPSIKFAKSYIVLTFVIYIFIYIYLWKWCVLLHYQQDIDPYHLFQISPYLFKIKWKGIIDIKNEFYFSYLFKKIILCMKYNIPNWKITH
jgi:hypothetical protein